MLQKGDKIPHFELINQNGELVSCKNIIGNTNLVIYFYPKDDTPGCTKEACSFRDQFSDFEDAGAKVIGVSADSPESHKSFANKYHLQFDLLSDTDNTLRKAFGVKGNLLGLIPGRVTFIADKNGVIQYTFDSQFNATKHVSKALEVLQEINR